MSGIGTSGNALNWGKFSGATVQFNSNGTVTATSGGNWFYPTTTDIGTGYYLKLRRDSGSTGVTFSQAVTSPVSLASNLLISATGGAGSATGRYFISTDSDGVNIVFTGVLSVSNAT